MKNFLNLTPTKIVTGVEKLQELDKILEKFNRICIMTGKRHLKETNRYEEIYNFFSSLGKEFIIISEAEQNPSLEDIEKCFNLISNFNPDVLIAIGGGSVIDTTKALAIKVKNPRTNIWNYVEGIESPEEALPIIAIPTTSGTGSEVNKIAVITNKQKIQKRSLRSEKIYPQYALLMPQLTITLNRYQTGTTAIDALSHAIEAMVSRKSNFITQALSEKSIKLIIENIFKAYNNGANLEARSNLQFASTLAGISMDISGVGLMHAIEHPITARFPHISHGQGLAIVFKKVIEHSFMFSVDKYKMVAEAMGIRTKGNQDFSILHTLLDAIEYILSYLDLNRKLSDFGVEKSDIKYLAEDTINYMTSSLNNSPYTPTKDSIEKILREIL
ncbi:MAG: iron-containing alcohol dehydrogenase family protein [Brevinematia bacterium]